VRITSKNQADFLVLVPMIVKWWCGKDTDKLGLKDLAQIWLQVIKTSLCQKRDLRRQMWEPTLTFMFWLSYESQHIGYFHWLFCLTNRCALERCNGWISIVAPKIMPWNLVISFQRASRDILHTWNHKNWANISWDMKLLQKAHKKRTAVGKG
jgi:hypothetical protein